MFITPFSDSEMQAPIILNVFTHLTHSPLCNQSHPWLILLPTWKSSLMPLTLHLCPAATAMPSLPLSGSDFPLKAPPPPTQPFFLPHLNSVILQWILSPLLHGCSPHSVYTLAMLWHLCQASLLRGVLLYVGHPKSVVGHFFQPTNMDVFFHPLDL